MASASWASSVWGSERCRGKYGVISWRENEKEGGRERGGVRGRERKREREREIERKRREREKERETHTHP